MTGLPEKLKEKRVLMPRCVDCFKCGDDDCKRKCLGFIYKGDVLLAVAELRKYIDNPMLFKNDFPERFLIFMKTLYWVKERMPIYKDTVDKRLLNTTYLLQEDIIKFNDWLINKIFGSEKPTKDNLNFNSNSIVSSENRIKKEER